MDDLTLAPPHLDPETLKNRGSILNVVKSAHKWGGNGTEPDFDKIKRVLMTKHPEVIAKAFGGDPNRAAAWIKDQWFSIFRPGVQWRGHKDKTPGFALPYQLVEAGQIETAELFLADDTSETSDSDTLVWLPISKTGRWAKSPLPGDKPLVLTKDFFDQVKQSFDEGAWEHVTVPLSHADNVDENTGFVKAVDVRPDPTRAGEWKLWGGIDFKLPEIRDKVVAGAIAGRSIGVATQGITRTLDGQHFPNVLKHVALTNQPWISGLDDGEQLAASYDLVDEPDLSPLLGLADSYEGSEAPSGGDTRSMPAGADWRPAEAGGDRCGACTHFTGEFCSLWNAPTDADHVSDGFEQVADTTTRASRTDLAALHAAHKASGERPVIRILGLPEGGDNMGEETLELTREEMDAQIADAVALALSQRDQDQATEMEEMRRVNRDLLVERKVAAAQAAGHAPAVIKAAREIWLADTRESDILTLSREDGEVTVSATTVVDDLLAAIPATALSRVDHTTGGHSDKPEGESATEKADAVWAQLHGEGE